MHRPTVALLLLLALVLPFLHTLCAQEVPVVEQRASTAVSEKLLAEAERILANCHTTSYSHKTKVDEKKGEYHVDCSGLLCYVLQRVAPEHLKAVPKEKGHVRALAEDFQAAFETASTDPAKATPWLRIERLADARPGDCLAWKRDPPAPGGSTGHVVILSEAPVQEEDGQFRVVLIDSTETHHAQDRRSEDKDGGVGRGTMWFSVDKQGRPSGYRWSRRDGKRTDMPIAVARAVEPN